MRYGQGIAIALIAAALAAPARGATPDEAQLRRAFGAFIQGGELRLDVVPDLYPGGYARISVYARGADLGGMLVDEAWFRLTGASLDPEALRGGTLRVLEVRDSAMYVRVSLRSLEAYFQRSDGVQDVRLSSDGQYLYGRGAVLLGGTPARVAFKGFFAVGGTKEIYFYIEDLRLNGLPVLTPLLRRWEQDINPIFSQALWPVTFKLRALRMTREGFVVSSQADPAAPCLFCT
ncbi:MAG TPA: hypothetical protein VNN19_01630, partial [bacterium]|nr:hypothetical protein [bacterium]